jgi:glycine/D-amino acid oxidase-like deaminating enzyme
MAVPPHDTDLAPDVIVIGGGIVGVSSAAHLAAAGRRVVLVERSDIAAGACGRNSGVVQHPFDPVLVELHLETLALYRALAETDRELHIVESILAKTPEIVGTSRRTGAELGLFATEQNTGDIVARLRPESRRDRSTFDVIDDVRVQIEQAVTQMRIEFVQIL